MTKKRTIDHERIKNEILLLVQTFGPITTKQLYWELDCEQEYMYLNLNELEKENKIRFLRGIGQHRGIVSLPEQTSPSQDCEGEKK